MQMDNGLDHPISNARDLIEDFIGGHLTGEYVLTKVRTEKEKHTKILANKINGQNALL